MGKFSVTTIVTFTDGSPEQVMKNPVKSEVEDGVVSFVWQDDRGRVKEVICIPLHRIKDIATAIEYED